MARKSKKFERNKIKRNETPLPIAEAVELLLNFESAKFDETVELAVKLGIDPKNSQQIVRGAVSLPHGIGKTVRVIAFAEGDAAPAAVEAGAIEVGGQDLAKKILDGWMEFDVAIAHPSMMRHVGKLGRILGPHGKMPSPKSGTVTDNVAQAAGEFVAGKVEFRNDSGGNIQAPVGKKSFPSETLSATMSPGVPLVISG